MNLLWSIVLALLAAPLVGALGLALAYLLLVLRGVSEHEGRRGLLAIVLALLAGLSGWIAGIRRAEARGVSNYAGERAAWGFAWYALPALIAGAVGGFALGTALFG